MAKSVRIGSTRDRMSSIVAGDRRRAVEDTVTANGSYTNVAAGMPVSRLKDYVGAQVVNPSKVGLEKPKNIPRSYVPSRIKQIFDPTPFATPVVAKKPPAKKPVAKPATVVSNVTSEKLSPTKAAPTRMAINPRTGNTTGFTTGKTTGTTASKPGVAGRTAQSAGDRMKANAMNRTNQPAGPMGGGGTRGSGSSRSTSSGGGNFGGAAGRGEPRGSKK